jgi:hypothetical protein
VRTKAALPTVVSATAKDPVIQKQPLTKQLYQSKS